MRNTREFSEYQGSAFRLSNLLGLKPGRTESGKPAFPLLFADTAEAEGLSPVGPERSGGGASRLDQPLSGGYQQL